MGLFSDRIERQRGRYALVDGIPFQLPVDSSDVAVLMAIFSVDYDRAKALLPGNELHPVRLWRNALLVVAVLDYHATDIGNYIEFSVGIACTQGARPAPRILPGLLMRHYGTGQFVYDLPVSTEVSVKGGKGIWGMPKHRANLDFIVGPQSASSRYDADGRMVMTISIRRPRRLRIPLSLSGTNYCVFRGLLMKSYVRFKGSMAISPLVGRAALELGEGPVADQLRALNIGRRPLLTAFCEKGSGVLDDHFESWFISHAEPPAEAGEGLHSVVDLGLGRDWLPPPQRPGPTTERNDD
jgi:hypothetical protein